MDTLISSSEDSLANPGGKVVTPGPVPQNDAERLLGLLNQFFEGLEAATSQHDPDTLYELGNMLDNGDGPSVGMPDGPWIDSTKAMVKRMAEYAYEQWAEDRRFRD